MSNIDAMDISIAIPCYNEEANAKAIARAVITQLEALALSFEILFIDNDSTDQTVPIIKRMCQEDKRIKLIVNSRNFGQLRSPTHAIYQARGAAVIGLCADFQDPPELIPELIRRWRAGADIVLGVRGSEKTNFLIRAWRGLGYRILEWVTDGQVIRHATGFGLYSRRAIDTLRPWNEPEPFFRSMLVETGLPMDLVSYHRPSRRAGLSKNNLMSLIGFSLSAWTSSSRRLLRGPIFVSLFLSVVSVMSASFSILSWYLVGNGASLAWIAFIELHFAILFFFLSLMSDQIKLISDRTRNVPLVIERERVNLESAQEHKHEQ